jgi:adenine phosphoribosyltransferase
LEREIKKFIKDIPNFPQEGILFRDIQPLLADSEAFYDAIYALGELIDMEKVDYFVGVESRGFIFAAALASINLKGFKMIRKAGKLPDVEKALHRVEYDLEYGSAAIEMESGWGNVVIVDDVLATGGTIKAAKHLATFSGYQVLDSLCLLDIGLIKNHNIKCLISY